MTFKSIDDLGQMIGQELPPSEWLTVTQEMINDFAKTTQDEQWIHVDVERAKKESPFGTTIAHGFLTLSLYSRFSGEVMRLENTKMAINYGANKVRFITPVPSGGRIRMVSKILKIEPYQENGHKIFTLGSILLEGAGKPACIVESIALVFY